MSARPEMPANGLDAYVPRLLAEWDGALPGIRSVEGTLVYADVSGFTRLSERLARRGRGGAEEVVRFISDVWSELLAVTGDGDPLKFAGDALIILFDGPDHAARACTAALAMQDLLARRESVRIGRSAVRLRMSVGIHSGTFSMAAVGTHHTDLLILGPAATRTVALQSAAGAGDVLVSGATAQLIGDRLVAAEPTADGLAIRRIEPVSGSRPSGRGGRADVTRFVSPLLRDILLSGPLAEHRRATIGFCQIGGVDRLLANEGADPVFKTIQTFVSRLMDILDRHGVLLTSCDLGSDGAVFMTSAGAPHAGDGDHELRMMHLAREVLDGDIDLDTRWGINSGHVFAGTVGPPERRAYVTMGDTTNLAARVLSKAAWGEVVATADSVPTSNSRLVLREIDPFTVKGKRTAVRAVAIEGLRQAVGVEVAVGDVFVGRSEELHRLEDAAAAATGGNGRVVEITGEQGVGKSRLVEEFQARWEGESFRVAGDVFERTTPYHTGRRLARWLLGIEFEASPGDAGRTLTATTDAIAPHLRPWLPLLGVILDAELDPTPESSDVDPRFRRIKAQQVMADLVARLSTRPLSITIEDAEHLDDASAELIAEILGRIEEWPWLVLITRSPARSGLNSQRGYEATEIALQPLSPDESLELALKLAESRPVPAHMIPDIVERASGNPLFMVEMLEHSGGELPNSVEDIVAARIDDLAARDRRTLRLLAVLGDTFDVALADAVLESEGIDGGDDRLWRRLAGFVERSDSHARFVNGLVRQVAYDGLPHQIRRHVHGMVADALGANRRDQLPLHLVRAERWEQAWTEARAAADRAREAAANAVAGELYEMALAAARNLELGDEEISMVAARSGTVWARAGLPDRALQSMNLAISTARDPVRRSMLEARRAAIHEDAGRYPQALRLLSRAINRLQGTEIDGIEAAMAALHATYASTRIRQGHHMEAREHASVAAEAAERAHDKRQQAQALHLLDRIHTALGERTLAQDYRDAALPLFAEIGDLAAQGTALHDLADEAQRHQRWDEAAWLYQRAADARSRAGDVVRAADTINSLGEVELRVGLTDSAERRFTEALRVWRGARSPEGVASATINLGHLRIEQGRFEEAIELLEEAEQLSRELGSDRHLTSSRLALAEAYLAEARHVEAWERATAALESLEDPTLTARARSVRASALEATGSRDRAREEWQLAGVSASPIAEQPQLRLPTVAGDIGEE